MNAFSSRQNRKKDNMFTRQSMHVCNVELYFYTVYWLQPIFIRQKMQLTGHNNNKMRYVTYGKKQSLKVSNRADLLLIPLVWSQRNEIIAWKHLHCTQFACLVIRTPACIGMLKHLSDGNFVIATM